MFIFTTVKRKIPRKPVFNSKFFFLLSFFLLSCFFVNAQSVTQIITDFGGYWSSSSTSLNPVNPNDSHNVLAFKVGTQIYSTGVNNSVLASKGVTYTAGNFKALPINSITGTVTSGAPIYIALAGNYDGVPNGFSNPLPSVKMKDVLTDGINGLNIGTGTTNIPATATMTFPVQSIDSNSITDSKPDILYTQIADPSTTGNKDVLYFVNSSGTMVGNSISVDWVSVPSLGTYILDLYTLQVGATCDNAVITGGLATNGTNTTRNIRLTAFKLSDFGITSTNRTSVTSLIVKPGGESDLAFVAYNTDAFVIAPPTITTQPQTQISCAGSNSNATFSVTATGTNDTYQWKKNGVNISGATGSTFTISPVTANDAGTYEVVVTNSSGTVTSNKAYLNTAITKQPSPASQTVVTGNIVTLTVSATNASSFQWKKGGVDIPGATDSIYTINPLTTSDAGSYTVSAINSNNSCATVLSNPAVINPAIVVYSKNTGNINVPAIWGANTDGSGSTPVDFTRAEHTFVLSNRSSGNTLTDLTIAGTLDVKDGIAIIANNTTLDVGKLIRSGTVGTVSGSSTAGLTVRGNSDLYFTSGSDTLKNLTITGGTVNVRSPLTITGGSLPGKLNLKGGTLVVVGNKITLRSSSIDNTSMVTAVGAGASITYTNGGAFVVERFIPAKRAFRFISPSVTTTTSIKRNWMEGVTNPDRWTNIDPVKGYGTHITGPKTAADSLDVTQTYNPSLFIFDKNTQIWLTVPNSSGTLTAGSPYRLMVRGSRSVDLNNNDAVPSNTILRTTGTLTIGTVNVSSAFLTSKIGGYSFIGNPYASPVNWLNLAKSGISSAYYTWDPSLNKRGAYVSYNSSSQANSSSASLVDENIQSGQAFFVQTTTSTPALQFQETNKTANNTSVFRSANAMAKLSVQLLLNLNGGSDNAADGLVAVYDNDFSKAIGDEDSYKFSNLDENIAINRNGTLLSIEGRPSLTVDTMQLTIWQYRQKEYWLKIDGGNFSSSMSAILKDEYRKQETVVNLSSSTIIPFNTTSDSASFAPDRFSIIFESYTTLPVTITDVKAYQKDKGIQVAWNAMTETNFEKYEVEKSLNGQRFDKVAEVSANSNSAVFKAYSWYDANASSGNNFYRIKIVEKTGTAKYSEIVRVNITTSKRALKVYPNPVKENKVYLQFSNLEKGTYRINIYNNLGQQVYFNSIEHKGGSSTQILLLDKKLGSGQYTLVLSNENTSINEKVIVEN